MKINKLQGGFAMKTQNLKNVIEVLTAFIYFCGFMTVAALVVHLLSRMGVFKDLIQTGRLSFDVNGIQLFPKHLQPLWQLLFPLALKRYLYLPSHHHSQLPPKSLPRKDLFSLQHWSLQPSLEDSLGLVLYVWHTWDQWQCLSPFPSLSNLPLTQGFSLPFQSSGSLARF